MTDREQREWDLKLRKLDAEIENLRALTSQSIEQARKIQTENRWYLPVVASAGTAALMAGTAALVRIFFV